MRGNKTSSRKRCIVIFVSLVMILCMFGPFSTSTSIAESNEETLEEITFHSGTFDWNLEEEAESETYVNVEVGNQFAVESMLCCRIKDGAGKIGYIREYEGLSFSSDNEQIASVVNDTYGVIECKSVGTAIVTVSYPKLDSIYLTVNVVEQGTIDKDGSIATLTKSISNMYSKKFTSKNIVSLYKQIEKKDWLNMLDEEHNIVNPLSYEESIISDNLTDYLEKKNAIFYCTDPLKVSKVKVNSNSTITITLSRKLNQNDLVAYCRTMNTDYKKNLKMQFRVIFKEGSKAASSPYNNADVAATTDVKLKSGTKSFTVSIPEELKSNKTYSALFSIDCYYGYSWTKGKTFKIS